MAIRTNCTLIETPAITTVPKTVVNSPEELQESLEKIADLYEAHEGELTLPSQYQCSVEHYWHPMEVVALAVPLTVLGMLAYIGYLEYQQD